MDVLDITTLSSTLGGKGRLEMGLWLAKTSESRVRFLRKGLMTAVFSVNGTWPAWMDLLMTFVMRGLMA